MPRKEKNQQSCSEALKAIQQKKIAPLYFILGEEFYLAEKIRKAIAATILGSDKDPFNYHQFYGKELRIESLTDALSSFPVMAERKIVVLKEADSLKKEEKEALLPFIEKPADSVCFIIISEKADFRQKFFQALENHATVVYADPIDERNMPEAIRMIIREKGKTITDEAVLLMSERLNLSLQEIEAETEKLVSYIGGRNEIGITDVEAVTGLSRQYHVFELCRRIAEKDFSGSLFVFRQMRLRGEEPVGMIALIFRHFNILWQAAECQQQQMSVRDIERYLTEHFKLFGSITGQYLRQMQQFKLAHLQRSITYLLEADRDIKSLPVRPDLIMEKLIYLLIYGERT